MIYSACIDHAAAAYHVPISQVEHIIESRHEQGGVGVMGIPLEWLPVLARYGFAPKKVTQDDCENITAGTWIVAATSHGPETPTTQDRLDHTAACERQAEAAYNVASVRVEQILSGPHPVGSIGPMGIPKAWLPLLMKSGFNPLLVETDTCMSIAAGVWILGVEGLEEGGAPSSYAGGVSPSIAPPAWLLPIVAQASVRYEMPESLILAVAAQESGFKPDVTSPAGAQGLMQLMPGTAAQYSVANPYNAVESVMGGVAYLADLRAQFDGNIPLMLAAYNAGSQAVLDYGDHIPPFQETEAYVPEVVARYRTYAAEFDK